MLVDLIRVRRTRFHWMVVVMTRVRLPTLRMIYWRLPLLFPMTKRTRRRVRNRVLMIILVSFPVRGNRRCGLRWRRVVVRVSLLRKLAQVAQLRGRKRVKRRKMGRKRPQLFRNISRRRFPRKIAVGRLVVTRRRRVPGTRLVIPLVIICRVHILSGRGRRLRMIWRSCRLPRLRGVRVIRRMNE